MSDHLSQSKEKIGVRGPFDSRWLAYVNGKTYGPYSGHDIRAMVEAGEILDTDLVVLEGASSWVQAKDDPVLRLLFIPTDAKPRSPPRHTARRGRRINLIASLLILGAMLWIVWPYYATYDLAVGFRKGDEATLQDRVDWESVRQGLRGDLNVTLLKSAGSDQSELGKGLAMALGPAFVNQMVDGYVTPQTFSRLAKEGRSRAGNESRVPAETEIQNAIRNLSADQVGYAFFSNNPWSFRIDVRPDKETPGTVTLLFKWRGDWKLTRVILPLDEIEKFGPGRRAQSAAMSQPVSPVVPQVRAPTLAEAATPWGLLFQKQVERCWKKPAGGPEAVNATAAFALRLKRDGTLDGAPIPEKQQTSPYLRSYQESALRAIVDCQPYNLPAASFEEWRHFAPVFAERGK